MGKLAIACIVVGLLGAAIAYGAVRSRLGRSPGAPERSRESRAWVRVLRSDEELREAAERALGFEREIAREVRTRISRYEHLGGTEAGAAPGASALVPLLQARDPDEDAHREAS